MKCLVIGGNGFLGYNVVDYLASYGFDVICFSKDRCNDDELIPNVKYVIGDIWDTDLLSKSLTGVDVVLDFLSTTMPNSNNDYLNDEVNRTLRYCDYILSAVQKNGIKHYIFPSSGGAIYGNTNGDLAKESDQLMPCTPYGVGKKMVEDMLRYYNIKFGIAISILRIGNIYGSKLKRDKAQGVIDILVQTSLVDGTFSVWGDALLSKRDYVFLDDVAEAIFLVITHYRERELRVFNIGSGKARSLQEIISLVEKQTGKPINLLCDNSKKSGVNQIVLSIEKIYNEIGWKPKTSLESGINQTIEYKKKIIKKQS